MNAEENLWARQCAILDNTTLPGEARLLMTALCRLANAKTGMAFATIEQLSKMTGLARQTIYVQRQALKTSGCISIREITGQRRKAGAEYTVHFNEKTES